jgi:hypothetical protein
MKLGTVDLASMTKLVEEIARAMTEAYDAGGQPTIQGDEPEALSAALVEFVEVLKRIEADERHSGQARLDRDEITELGEYGMSLLQHTGRCAQHLRQAGARELVGEMVLPVTLWIIRHGGHISVLEPAVDALAALANTTRKPSELLELSSVLDEVINRVSPSIQDDLEASNPGRPWRILLLNAAIVATRSHSPFSRKACGRWKRWIIPSRFAMSWRDTIGSTPFAVCTDVRIFWRTFVRPASVGL